MAESIKADLRRLETLGRPVVAAINGAALGGGLEIALACHHRIVVDDPKVDLGLPEATLGLLPGGGGVTRTVRMLGIQSALMDVLLQGTALQAGGRQGEGSRRRARQEPGRPGARGEEVGQGPQGRPDRRLEPVGPRRLQDPGRYAVQPEPGGVPARLPGDAAQADQGCALPGPRAIMAAAIEGAQVDFDTASRIESRYLAELITGSNSKNMIQAFFFDLSAINRRLAAP